MMRKEIKMIMSLCMICLTSNAQPKACPTGTPPSHKNEKMTIVDTAIVRVWYALNADDLRDESSYIDKQRLEIGARVTKYYSEFIFRSDSLITEYLKKAPDAPGIPHFMGQGGKNKDRWSEYQYSELFMEDGVLTEYATMPQWLGKYNSRYSEPYPLQQWTIQEGIETILGHECQKATCHWRGRDFVAWFAPDIPVNAGPWKFGGLPGLILKLEDTDGLYRFEAVGLSSQRCPIRKYAFKGYAASTREKVWKMQKSFNENWFKAVGFRKCTVDAAGRAIPGEEVSKYTPYEPLEKE